MKVGKGNVPAMLGRKPFDCDALRVSQYDDRPLTVVIDQRIDTRWQMLSLLDRPYGSTYHFAARKSVLTLPPSAVANLNARRIG